MTSVPMRNSRPRNCPVSRHGRRPYSVALAACLAAILVGCTGGDLPETEHEHYIGSHSGIIVSVGSDHYHVEVLFVNGEMRFYTLDHDQQQVLTVPDQEITAYVRSPRRRDAVAVSMVPTPQDGDPDGQTSLFVGRLPDELLGDELLITVPNITFGENRYRFSCRVGSEAHSTHMPEKVTALAESDLYLKPGGRYTEADIAANGRQTASQKYADFQSAHDFKPQPGDAICPVTQTKANAACTWIVDGKTYKFCCPPCIDEFVKLAKSDPEAIKPPEDYVKP